MQKIEPKIETKIESKIVYKWIIVSTFLLLSFLFGVAVATVEKELTADENKVVAASIVQKESQNWGLSFGKEGTTPTGNATKEELVKYNAYYVGPESSTTNHQSTTPGTPPSDTPTTTPTDTLYLTFDAGYENGYTEAILDALKKHNAKATFFVVGHYLETAPDLIKRMVEEGHTVGNHTYHHKDMSAIEDGEIFKDELQSVNQLYKEITGEEMPMYYRPPQGKFSTTNLTQAKELGYQTFFWSLAYVDWIKDDQPTREEAFDKLLKRVHPGAIVLLHSTSQTNAEILDELLTKWEEMGYKFGILEEILPH